MIVRDWPLNVFGIRMSQLSYNAAFLVRLIVAEPPVTRTLTFVAPASVTTPQPL